MSIIVLLTTSCHVFTGCDTSGEGTNMSAQLWRPTE